MNMSGRLGKIFLQNLYFQTFVCLFVGVLGHVDYTGHFAPNFQTSDATGLVNNKPPGKGKVV